MHAAGSHSHISILDFASELAFGPSNPAACSTSPLSNIIGISNSSLSTPISWVSLPASASTPGPWRERRASLHPVPGAEALWSSWTTLFPSILCADRPHTPRPPLRGQGPLPLLREFALSSSVPGLRCNPPTGLATSSRQRDLLKL